MSLNTAIEAFKKVHGREPTPEEIEVAKVNFEASLKQMPFSFGDGGFEVVHARLASLDAKIDALVKLTQFRTEEAKGVRTRVMWQDKVSKSGIDLGNSMAMTEQTGYLIGVNVVPTGPSSASLMAVVKVDKGQEVVILDISKISFLD